jgi:hypothetical protein
MTMNMDQRSIAAPPKVIERDAKVALDRTFGPAKTVSETETGGNILDSSQQTQHQAIQQKAYSIWEAEGHPHGKDVEHWLRAERLIVSRRPH